MTRPAVPIMPPDPEHPDDPHTPIDPDVIPPLDVPDGLVRIIAAYVNDVRTPERETVTLLNTSDRPVDLERLDDRRQAETEDARSPVRSKPARPASSSCNPVDALEQGRDHHPARCRGIKVHGVSYTKAQARQPGRTIPFQF